MGRRGRGGWVHLLELELELKLELKRGVFGGWRQWEGSGRGRRRLGQLDLVLRRLARADGSHYWDWK